MRTLLDAIRRVWKGPWFHYYDRIVHVGSLADVPQDIRVHEAYVIGEPRSPHWIGFTCPCGCNRRLLLPLSVERYPHWSVLEAHGRPSISPSVDAQACGAHFFIRDGSVEWCRS